MKKIFNKQVKKYLAGKQWRVNKSISIKLDDAVFLYAMAALVFAVGFALAGWFVYQYMQNTTASPEGIVIDEKNNGAVNEQPVDCDYHRLIDGVCVDAPNKIAPPLVAVMIENHIDARPQSGLADARIVYEAPVEGNISRFLAIYTASTTVDKVGPVRSARPYYLDWVREYGEPLYAHVGGSPESLSDIRRFDINDLNQFAYGYYFWRSRDRWAPHNVYTSSELWQGALAARGEQHTDAPGWSFSNAFQPCEEECVETIEVDFAPPAYAAEWQYDVDLNHYWRSQQGFPHKDSNGTPIAANTVIVQFVDTRVIDRVGRLSMETVGEGRAVIFKDGRTVEGRWEKEDAAAPTKWLDENGEAVTLNPGKIWVEVLNRDNGLSFE